MDKPGKNKQISREEELILVRKAQAGDTDARNLLVKWHYPFVMQIVRSYNRQACLMDMVQEACIGLMEAIQEFDESRGFRLLTMAYWPIRRGAIRGITQNNNFTSNRSLRRIIKHSLERRIPDLLGHIRSLDATFDTEGHMTTLGATIPDNHRTQAEEVEDAEYLDKAVAIIESLRPRIRKVVEMRLGLGEFEPSSFVEIGTEIGVTAERARKMYSRAMFRVRKHMNQSS